MDTTPTEPLVQPGLQQPSNNYEQQPIQQQPMQQQPMMQQPAYGQQQPMMQQPAYGQQQPMMQQPAYGQQQPMMQQPAYGQQPTNPQQIVYQGVDQNADMAPSAYPEAVPQDMATGQLKEEDEARCDQLSFLRKVLGIVAGQLLLTFICIVGASYSYDFGLFCTSLGCQLTSFFLYIFSMIALLCSRGLRHSVPANYIVLGLFTASMAFMLSGVTAWLTPESVLMAIGVLVIVLSMMWIGVLCVDNKAKLMMGVLIAVFAAIILQLCLMIPLLISGFVEGMWVLYCFLGVIICAGLIYFDLFIIMLAGKYAMDEYIYCAILLYVDIIRMLIYLLMIFGKAK